MSDNYHLKRFVVFGDSNGTKYRDFPKMGADAYLKDFDHKEAAVGYATTWVAYPGEDREAHVWDTKEMWIICRVESGDV